MKTTRDNRAFTILEVLITLAVLTVLSAAGIMYFRSSIIEVAAGSAMQSFVADIEAARGRAIAGDRGMTWGVRALPASASWEFYATGTRDYAAEPFSTETKTLPVGVSWIDPSSVPRSVEFAPLSGATASTTFTIGYSAVRLMVSIDDRGTPVITRVGG